MSRLALLVLLSRRRLALLLLLVALAVLSAGCFISNKVRTQSVTPGEGVTVESPVKAHLVDGTTVVYTSPVTVRNRIVYGSGLRYDLRLELIGGVDSVPLDSLVAMEGFSTEVDYGKSFLLSTLATVGTIGAAVAIACAADPKCFGSCPTVYSDSVGMPVLEAEAFSYSIAPAFEGRDVDRLRAQPVDGILRLEIRNEAFETHYLNHLDLLEVLHDPSEVVIPDSKGIPLALEDLVAPARAVDRVGRDRRAEVSAHDGVVFRTDSTTLFGATADNLADYLDLEFPVYAGQDSVVLVFRQRNSLLATVLLYELMLGDRGAHALNWLASDLTRPGPAIALGLWAKSALGMGVDAWDGEEYHPIGRIPDTGPVAWKDVAFTVPVPRDQSTLRIRLSFPADNWRIDKIALARRWRRPTVRIIPLTNVVGADEQPNPAALEGLSAADDRYVTSSAGQYFFAEFDTGPETESADRTFLLGARGYYLEWIRRTWLETGRDTTAFQPGTASLFEAIRRWRESQDTTERRFSATRVPVR